jgi:hypothetical protein
MDWTSDTAYAKYGSFSVASDGYKLNLGSFSSKYDLININFIKYSINLKVMLHTAGNFCCTYRPIALTSQILRVSSRCSLTMNTFVWVYNNHIQRKN